MSISKPLMRGTILFAPMIPLLLAAGLLAVGREPPRGGVPAHLHVPEGFTIERAADPSLLSYPMFGSFDDEGRLFVFESTRTNTMTTEEMLAEPSYHVRLLEDEDGDGVFDRSWIFADELPFPKGGVFYRGSLYVSAAPDLLRLRDTDGDGVADEREVVLTGWTLNRNGAALGGPFMGPDGWLYLTDARRGFEIERRDGEVLKGKSARIWRVRPDGTGLEWVSAGGFDNSVELAFLPSGETLGTMTYFTEPERGLRDAVMHWVEGGVYPKPHPVIQADSLKVTGELMPTMTRMGRVAPSGIVRYRGDGFGAGFDGNLFTAQFNTGRVLRHVLVADGATFRTEDTPFMTATSTDAHPTDVLQDADGSLLVLETGGWFINGCPLSRIAKPDVRGGIYRIRRAGAAPIEDPWGRELDLRAKSPRQLVGHLTDARPAVRDRAMERLVEAGEASVGPLVAATRRSDSEEMRTAAVFALYRIGTPAAMRSVRGALDDGSSMVRTAAARAVGLARDSAAVERLIGLLGADEPAVRRQAATALGQIGHPRSVDALVAAAADPDDRFVEHAAIYALIRLGQPRPLMAALAHPSSDVRRVALIALDQMDGSPLTRHHLAPFLASADARLRSAGIWVASHHADWADLAVGFLTERVGAADVPESEAASLRDLMVAFCHDARLQRLVAGRLGSAQAATDEKLNLLEVMDRCPTEDIPPVWVRAIGAQLGGEEARVRSRALRLVRSRGVAPLQEELARIVADGAAPAHLRLEALGALAAARGSLLGPEFRLAVQHLGPRHEPSVRQAAAAILGVAELSEAQLVSLAAEVARADIFLLPRLLEAFQATGNSAVGLALVAGLGTSPDRLENLPEKDLEALLAQFPAPVRASAEPLMAILRERHAERLARLRELEARLGAGDVAEGRELFFGRAACSACHAVGSRGGDFGPDLTNIGEIRSRHDILEAIVYPSASFAREYEPYRVRTGTSAYTGTVEELPGAVVITAGPDSRIRVPRAEIVAIDPVNVSPMPPGLERQLTSAELAHLVAFLEALPYGRPADPEAGPPQPLD